MSRLTLEPMERDGSLSDSDNLLSDSASLDTPPAVLKYRSSTSKSNRVPNHDTKSSDNHSQSCSSLNYEDYVRNNIRNIVNDENLSDVVFIVEEEELYGIRCLFASQSIVFRQMLYGSMMESQSGNCVILNDITIHAFKYLRNTFYNIFDDPLTPSIVVDVLFAAQKYLIDALTVKCIKFIKDIESLDDWFLVLNKFEDSPFQLQAKLYLNKILNEGETPYILQYKSLKFAQNPRFCSLKRESIILLINSDYLAAKEDEIWEALLRWTRFNSSSKSLQRNEMRMQSMKYDESVNDEDEKVDSESDAPTNTELNASQKELMDGFIKYIRFNQMDAIYFKTNIVDKMILPLSHVINIMFARENGTKWKSSYNDKQRIKSKTMDTFQLKEVCLSLSEICDLKVGDLIDFRDYYGLFCPASIIEVDHERHKMKIHYNSWGSSYDEWYNYQATEDNRTADNNDTNDDIIRLTQKDKNSRIAQYGSITNRKIQREYFRKKIEEFTRDKQVENNTINHECQVKLSYWFWKKNESYIDNKHLYVDKWINAKIIGYKTAAKYSDHIKVGIYIHDDHFEYWLHPDNEEEIQPFPTSTNHCS